ncbi:MAG: hypothetical protein ACFFB2_14650 [Promethearchaeota archaeon]
MIPVKDKFPFKWMLKIITTLEKDSPLTSLQIAKSIGSCVSDAAEVTRMLHYITSFGKIEANSGGEWRIFRKKEYKGPPPKNYKENYGQNLEKIIHILTEEAQTIEELMLKISLEKHDLTEDLSFLALITEKGYIHLQESSYPQQWSLKFWSSSF